MLTGVPQDIGQTMTMLIVPTISLIFIAYIVPYPKHLACKPLRMIQYLFWLYLEIIKSSISVIKIIWVGNQNIKSGFALVSAENFDEFKTILYANSITLTPGTITIDIRNNQLLVHALDVKSIDDLNNKFMYNKVESISN